MNFGQIGSIVALGQQLTVLERVLDQPAYNGESLL